MTDGIAKDRLEKLEALRAAGVSPYPPRTPKAEPVQPLLDAFDSRMGQTVTLAGRLTQVRDFGKLRFSHLHDQTGHVQIGFERDRLPAFWPDRKRIEANDLVVVTGEVGRTQKGEATIWAKDVVLASKALRQAHRQGLDCLPTAGVRRRLCQEVLQAFGFFTPRPGSDALARVAEPGIDHRGG